MSRSAVLTDAHWARIEPLMPWSGAQRGGRFVTTARWSRGSSTGSGPGWPGVTCRRCSGRWQTVWKRHQRFSTDGTWDRIHARLVAEADAAGEVDWTVWVDSTINRAHQHATTAWSSGPPGTQGAQSSYTNLRAEPPDHALGRSRGGLSTKIHQLVDGRGRPLVIALGPGRAGTRRCCALLATCAVDAARAGRPRTRPDARARRQGLLLPGEPSPAAHAEDQGRDPATLRPDRPPQAPRVGRRSAAGLRRRWPTRAATSSNAPSTTTSSGAALATRYDKLAIIYRGGVVLRAITIWLRE